jgi:hypothetical protein
VIVTRRIEDKGRNQYLCIVRFVSFKYAQCLRHENGSKVNKEVLDSTKFSQKGVNFSNCVGGGAYHGWHNILRVYSYASMKYDKFEEIPNLNTKNAFLGVKLDA